MSAMASQITGVSIVCSTVGSGADGSKYQSSASLAFLRGIHRWPVNSPHKRPVTQKMLPYDDVIMWDEKSVSRDRSRHWGCDKMAVIFTHNFSEKSFPDENCFILIQISLNFVPGIKLTIDQHWFVWWLGTEKPTNHYTNQSYSSLWRILGKTGFIDMGFLRNPCMHHIGIPMSCSKTSNWNLHDDVIKWKHFPRYWPFVRRIHRSPVNSPHKGQWQGALMFSLICTWINSWVNNPEAGDLRRHRAHCDVSVMITWFASQMNGCGYIQKVFILFYSW